MYRSILLIGLVILSGCKSFEVKQSYSGESLPIEDVGHLYLQSGSKFGDSFFQRVYEIHSIKGNDFSFEKDEPGVIALMPGKYTVYVYWKVAIDGGFITEVDEQGDTFSHHYSDPPQKPRKSYEITFAVNKGQTYVINLAPTLDLGLGVAPKKLCITEEPHTAEGARVPLKAHMSRAPSKTAKNVACSRN